jgi:hypothetical protein
VFPRIHVEARIAWILEKQFNELFGLPHRQGAQDQRVNGLKIAVLAPMPNASVMMMTALKPGFREQILSA